MSTPSNKEKQCNLQSNSASDYNECMDRAHLSVFTSNRIRITPNQAMNRAVSLILFLLFLHYIKVITLPVKFIPQMK
jgi:hypothetical protein